MTTTYRPIVTPAFMLADASDTAWGTPTSLNEATRDGIAPEFSFSVQAIHAARAEVLGELERLLEPEPDGTFLIWEGKGVRMIRASGIHILRQALRASLDDPEEGSA